MIPSVSFEKTVRICFGNYLVTRKHIHHHSFLVSRMTCHCYPCTDVQFSLHHNIGSLQCYTKNKNVNHCNSRTLNSSKIKCNHVFIYFLYLCFFVNQIKSSLDVKKVSSSDAIIVFYVGNWQI